MAEPPNINASPTSYRLKREESPLDFLDSISRLSSTPLRYTPGYNTTIDEIDELDASNEQPSQEEDEKAKTWEEEKELLRTDPHTYVRSRIRHQVQDVIWLEHLRQQLEEMEEKRKTASGSYDDRCIVCTLPYGTCIHTQEWVDDKNPLFVDKPKDAVEKEMDDLMAAIGGSVEIETEAVESDDIEMETMKWVPMYVADSDKIGDSYTSLATPHPRGWHSAVYFEKHNFIVVFGGFRYKKGVVPQPFDAVVKERDVEFLNDICVYDLVGKSWHAGKVHPQGPGGRYGHVAAAIDEDRMMIFGGRGGRGQFLSDTWIYDIINDVWTLLDIDASNPPPAPRVFSSAHSNGKDVYLFGGTDGVDNFGDLWIFRANSKETRWERTIAVGTCPSPRYGHRVIVLHEPMQTFTEPRIAIVGGCTVSPQSEVQGAALTAAETKQMLDLGRVLESSYRAEGAMAQLHGQTLEANLGSMDDSDIPGSMKGLYRTAAQNTAHLHTLEMESRAAEVAIVEAHHLMEASKSYKIKKARHPNPHTDVFILNTEEMTWQSQLFPKIKGSLPPSRMHFGCFSRGNHIILVGGAKPTSLGHSVVEGDHSRLYVLELSKMIWSQVSPQDTGEYLEIPLRIAEAEVMRAISKVALERDRGKALGAKNGMTMEVAEAEAVLKVCKWRANRVKLEIQSALQPPPPRWGSCLVGAGPRAYYLNGWYSSEIVGRQEAYVLDLEQEHERRRREDEEFHRELEAKRRAEESQTAAGDMQSAYELRQLILNEAVNAAKERHKMGIEDILSSIPAITTPEAPRLLKANAQSLWLGWDPVEYDSREIPVNPEKVQYKVYMITSYNHVAVGDRVYVMPAEAVASMEAERREREKGPDDDDVSVLTDTSALHKAKIMSNMTNSNISLGSIASSTQADGSPSKSADAKNKKVTYDYSSYRGDGFPGEIVAMDITTGRFSIAFDDGTSESGVHRKRVRLQSKVDKENVEDSDDEYEEEDEKPEGMAEEQWQAIVAKEKKWKEKNAKLNFFGKESYMVRESMSIVAKKRIVRKLGVRQRKLEALQHFYTTEEKRKELEMLEKFNKKRKGLKSQSDDTKNSAKVENGVMEEKTPKEDDEWEEEQDLELDPSKGFDRHKYIASLETPKGDGKAHRLTVKVPSKWDLIYCGSDTTLEVGGIVPADILRLYPDYECSVRFVMQVVGVDFPSYEHSKMSDIVEYWTRPTDYQAEDESADDPMAQLKKELEKEKEEERLDEDGHPIMDAQTAMASKKRKELLDSITAARREEQKDSLWEKNAVLGEGTGDYFM